MAYNFRNNQDYIQYLLQKAQEDQGSYLNKVKNINNKVYGTGQKMSTAGDFLQKNFNSPFAQNLGSKLSGYGNQAVGSANNISNVLNAPKNFFQGYAPKPFNALFSNSGAATSGALGGASAATPAVSEAATASNPAIAQAIQSAAPMASIGGTVGGTAAGTTAGTTAATTGATAAGGAAAGGAAGAAAFSNPVTALIALAVMAAMGTNRKRAKKSGKALMEATDKTVNEESDASLNQAQQFAQNMQNQTQDYSQPVITGGAAPVEQQQLTPIQEYQNALREQGYSDDVINGVPQGLNSGDKNIAQWIEQYNNGSGRDNPIRIPQTEEEIALARAGNFNVPAQSGGITQDAEVENTKKGLLDKFINGITDFSKGYQENRNNAFKPENLQRDDSKSKMNRIGEVLGTLGRVAQKPAVQGLVAGGVSTALTGNPLYGLGKGYEFANNRAMSNIRRDVLKDYGVNIPDSGTFGNITSNDMRNIGNMAETQAWHEYLKKKNADELAAKIEKNEADKIYKEGRIEALKQNANTNAYKAKNGSKVTRVKSGGNSSKSSYQIVNGKDGNVYLLNKATGEYKSVNNKRNGSVINNNNSGAESEEDFRNRVFKNKKSGSNNKGWAF